MRKRDFGRIILNTPRYEPTFRVKYLPGWAEPYVRVGDILTWNRYTHTFVMADGRNIGLTASYVEFAGYVASDEVKA